MCKQIESPKCLLQTNCTPTTACAQGTIEEFLAAGFTQVNVLEVILAIGIKTLSNYTNHVCHTELDSVFEARRWTDA